MKTLLLLVAALSITACTKKKEQATDGPIIATVGMIADVTQEIAGDKQDVIALIKEGTDPHSYNVTAGDTEKIKSSRLVLYNGLLLEGKMGTVLDNRREAGHPTMAVAEGLEDVELIGGEEHADPHLWMDVGIWSRVAEGIQKKLAEFDPDNADHYSKRFENYRKELTDLQTYAQMALSTIPPERRVLVTAHDAFSYLGRAYGLKVMGIQGISTESEAGNARISELVNFLVEKKIPAVFVETSVSDKTVRALIEGAKAQGHEVKIGGKLFSDAMGPAGTYEGTYIGMMDHNITTITLALGGSVSKEGLNKKLSR